MFQIIQSALSGMLIVCLGFFIKKWIQDLDDKMNKIGVELDLKTNKTDCQEHIKLLSLRCDKREKLIIAHSHTDEGKIIIN